MANQNRSGELVSPSESQSRELGLFFQRDALKNLELPKLPYAEDALEPIISAETVHFHYDKHSAGYFKKLHELVKGSDYETMSLEEIVRASTGEIHHNAGQAWNHVFYWSCLAPVGQTPSNTRFLEAIEQAFGSFDQFKEDFMGEAKKLFGSGWTFLMKDENGRLRIENHANEGHPLQNRGGPILTCDVWEHAYYIDYRNERENYLENFWQIVNWNFVEANFDRGIEVLFH